MSLSSKRAEAEAAKTSLFANLGALKSRLAPSTLVNDAVESAREKAIGVAEQTVETARNRPVLTGSLAAATALFFIRKPACALVRRMTGSKPKANDRATGLTEGTSS